MTSLFFRIWIAFWSVIVITILSAFAIDYFIVLKRSQGIDSLSLMTVAAAGTAAIEKGGDDNLRHWVLVEQDANPQLQIYVVDKHGRELRGHSLAEVEQVLLRRKQGQAFPAEVAASAHGQSYRFIFDRTASLSFDLWNILFQPGVLFLLVLITSGAGSAWLSWLLSKPIATLRTSVHELTSGNLDVRADARLSRRRDELGSLARDFNQMALRLKEFVTSKEELLRYVSHQLRSPLARLRVTTGLARRRATQVELENSFDQIDKEVERVDELIGQIILYSRAGHRSRDDLSIVEFCPLVEELVEDGEIEARAGSKRVVFTSQASVSVNANRELLRSACENVLRNAIRHAPPNSSVEVRLDRDGADAVLTIADDGPGVPESDLSHIFEPFVHDGEGAGLGLAITSEIVRLHRGSVVAFNRAPNGLEVHIRLPSASLDGQLTGGISP